MLRDGIKGIEKEENDKYDGSRSPFKKVHFPEYVNRTRYQDPLIMWKPAASFAELSLYSYSTVPRDKESIFVVRIRGMRRI